MRDILKIATGTAIGMAGGVYLFQAVEKVKKWLETPPPVDSEADDESGVTNE
jgi:hypothetical protein